MKITLVCHCDTPYIARAADIARGWAKACSKSCAAKVRDRIRPPARHLDGTKVKWGKKYLRVNPPNDSRVCTNDDWRSYDDDPSWDAHKS